MILYTMLEYFSRFVSRTALENFFLARGRIMMTCAMLLKSFPTTGVSLR